MRVEGYFFFYVWVWIYWTEIGLNSGNTSRGYEGANWNTLAYIYRLINLMSGILDLVWIFPVVLEGHQSTYDYIGAERLTSFTTFFLSRSHIKSCRSSETCTSIWHFSRDLGKYFFLHIFIKGDHTDVCRCAKWANAFRGLYIFLGAWLGWQHETLLSFLHLSPY